MIVAPQLAFGEIVDEAFARAGIASDALVARHLIEARRSMMLMLTEIETSGAKPEFRVDDITLPIAIGQQVVVLPVDTIDVLTVVWRMTRQGDIDLGRPLDRQLARTNRDDWLAIADKGATGYVSSFWVSKSRPSEISQFLVGGQGAWGGGSVGGGGWGGASSPTATLPSDGTPANLLVLWPVPTEAGTIVASRLRMQKTPETLDEVVDTHRPWYDTVCAGLAARMAQKFAPARYGELKGEYEMLLKGRLQSEDHGPVQVGFRAFGFSRNRRH